MLGSTDPSSIWGQFFVRCYSSGGPAKPVCLSMIGGPGPVVPTLIYGREKLLGVVLYWPKTNHVCCIFM